MAKRLQSDSFPKTELPAFLWTVKDLSERLNVKPGTIRYWVHIRAIRYRKLGNLVRFIPEEIADDFAAGKIGKP